MAAFVREHQLQWDYMELLSRHGDSITATEFRKRMDGRNVTTSAAHSFSSLYVSLPKTPELYFANHGKKMRRNLNYYSRALRREGPVEFVTIQHAPEIENAFDDLLRLHAARFVARGQMSAFLDPRVTSFHRAVLRALSEANWVRIYLLKLGGGLSQRCTGFLLVQKCVFTRLVSIPRTVGLASESCCLVPLSKTPSAVTTLRSTF